MSTTQDILDAARKLGEMISQHDAAQKLESALTKLQDDQDAQKALNDYNRCLQTIAEKEAAGQPIEVEDKRQLESLQAEVIRSPVLRDFQVAQMDYVDLMRKVDEAMAGPRDAASPMVDPG